MAESSLRAAMLQQRRPLAVEIAMVPQSHHNPSCGQIPSVRAVKDILPALHVSSHMVGGVGEYIAAFIHHTSSKIDMLNV